MRRWATIVACLGLFWGLAGPAAGQWTQTGKLLPIDGATHDWFGHALAVDGCVAVVGAPWDGDLGESSGSAYVFRYDGSAWVREAKLLAADGSGGDHFGHAVALRGDVAVIGAYSDDTLGMLAGSAYVFRHTAGGWVQEVKLYASDPWEHAMFGRSVSVSGNVVVVGAHQANGAAAESGAAYVFRHDGSIWLEEAKLFASDGTRYEFFGRSVAVSGNVVVAGTPEDDDGDYNVGSAYVFRFDGLSWAQETKLLASDGAAWDYFGESVAVDEDAIVVGVTADDDAGPGSGSAYVFRFSGSTWSQEAKLVAPDAAEYDYFGSAVAISGDAAIIGSPGDDDGGTSSGSAYVFGKTGPGWVYEQKLLASDGAASDQFGASVSIGSHLAMGGAFYDDDNGDDSGSASVFLSGCVGDLDGDGDADADDVAILAACITGPDAAMPPACTGADLHTDADVDLADYAVLQRLIPCGG
ncbi:MAG: FG-GAP repeat protein [Phycisphaerae bacterium]|nr:FG-GAP repeat protein [Phycisphaerae bacterium]